MKTESVLPTVAVIGGTGKEGKGLAYRWLRAGYRVILGSRSSEKAAAAASELSKLLGKAPGVVAGASNLDAAKQAGIVVITVPYAAHTDILASIKPTLDGKLLIDATVPLVPGQLTRTKMPSAGSAAQETRQLLGETVEVAAAFHNISHEHLFRTDPIDCDVLVTGTSAAARAATLMLVTSAGLRGWDAGALENSAVSEGLASVLIHINKKYGTQHAGIRITGVEQP
jgi:NADPH-dependent F420 reductase